MHLTLHIAAAPPAATPIPQSPSLLHLLARADRLPDSAHDAQGSVCALFDPALGEAPPVAALSAMALGLDPATGYWLRADPVHLQPTRDDLLVSGVDDLSDSESQALIETLNGHLGRDGVQLRAGAAGCWFMALPAPLRLRTVPLPRVEGAPMGAHLPQGEDARIWLGRLTECQMLLHEHPCNEQREQQGKPSVNGLWLWGGGTLPVIRSRPFDLIYGDDAVLQGLARVTGIPHHRLPAGYPSLGRADRVLASLGRPDDPAKLESLWFAPLRDALIGGALRTATIMLSTSTTHVWEVRRRHLWRFWRRPLAPAQ